MKKYKMFRPPFSFLISVIISCIFITSCHLNKPKQISVVVFGAMSNDGQNDALQLRKALDYCKINPGTVLYFPPGIYDFRDEKAVGLMDGIMKGKVKGNPQDSIFRPYYPYVKGLDFDGVHDVTVEAAGAILLCDGWMEPVSLENCKNIRLKGLTIDYKRKPHSVGEITDVQPDYYEAVFDSIYPVTAQTPLCRTMFWDTRANRMLYQEEYFPKFEVTAPQKLRIYSKLSPELKGDKVLISHCFHFRPAIFIFEAENLDIQDVTIHSQPGMGIVGHRSKNITLTGLRIVPSAGRVFSTNTDATHFTSCKGFIRYINCQFEGHGDDAVNIHNYYYTIQKPVNGKGYDLVVKGADWHAQVLDYPDPGDTLELVDKSTLAIAKKFIVKTRENNIAGLRSQVTLNEELPAEIGNYYFINSTRLPSVEIIGCTVTSNRARGFLIKTRNVLIEQCLIRETTGTGIHIGAEGGWHEGPTSANVTVRYNRIIRCSRGAGTIDDACGIAVSVGAPNDSVPGLHKHILIEGNMIEGEHSKNGISISGASDVVVRYNEITGCTIPINVKHSDNVNVYSNPGVHDQRTQN
jgi:hypothetical protein